MAYHQHPKTIDGRTFDFDAMYKCDPYKPNDNVITFISKVHYSFPSTSIIYGGHEGTVIHPANIQTVLQKMGYKSYRYIPGYDYKAILNSLKAGRPTTFTGFELDSEMSSAHTWVIDGHLEYRRDYKEVASQYFNKGVIMPSVTRYDTEYRQYFHYNLGWKGIKDAYFFAGVFDTDNGQGKDEGTVDDGLGVTNSPMLKSNGSNDYRNRIKMWVDIDN